MGRFVLASAALAVALLGGALVASAASAIDQQQPTIDTSAGGLVIGGGSHQKLAQVVTAGLTGALTAVAFPVACDAGNDLVVEIQDVAVGPNGGQPNGTVRASQTVAAASLPSFGGGPVTFRQIAFASTPVSTGGVFAIVLRSASASTTTSCGVFPGPVGDPYPGGQAWFDAAPNSPGWLCVCGFPNERQDLPFQTYVDAAPIPSVDLALTKFASANAVGSGQQFTYALGVSNLSTTAATNVTVIDMLPAGATFVSASAGCTHSAGVVTCTQATLPANASTLFQITVTAPVVSGAVPPLHQITNTATVSATEPDPNSANNSASVTTTVSPLTDLALTKTGPATAVPGSSATFTITVTNNGPSDATNVLVLDPVPAGTVFSSISSPQTIICGQSLPTDPYAGEYGCRFATLANGASATIAFTVQVSQTAGSSISNTATAYAGLAQGSVDLDPNTANNSATATVALQPSADLRLSMSSPNGFTVGTGRLLGYSIDVLNAGPSTATGVTVVDTLPAGTTLVFQPSFCSNAGLTVTCNIGSLPPSTPPLLLQLVVRAPSTTGTGMVTNTASVSANEPDPNPANNSATVTTTVVAVSADLSLVKTAGAATIGSNLVYTLTAHNSGPDFASRVTISDTLPAGTTFSSGSWQVGTSTGTCSASGSTVTCGAPYVIAGQDMVATITVTPSAVGSLTNTASVSADEPDPNTGNNSASTSVYVRGVVDLALTKSDVGGLHLQGGQVTYSLAVANAGPNEATQVTVVDTLPAGTSYATGNAGCSAVGGTVTCAFGTLAAGTAATAVIVVNVNTTGSITNSAVVSTRDADTNSANDTSSVTSLIVPSTDLAVTQTATPGPNSTVTFTTTVTNNGPSVSHQALAFTAAPAGTSGATISSPDTLICGLETTGPFTGKYGCRFVTIAAGGSVTMRFVFQLSGSTTSGSVTVTAYAGAGEFDPNGANDSATTAYSLGATPAGANVTTKPVDRTSGTQPVSVTFTNVTAPGDTTLTTSAAGPTPPPGFTGLQLGSTYYDLHTTATFSGTIRVCITDASVTTASRLFHYETNPTPPPAQIWVDRTVLPVTPPTICADVTSFSIFAVFRDITPPTITIASPTATTYTLGQRVLASYTCTDAGTGVTRCAGTVASGARIDTSALGTKTFTVDAQDGAGNAARQTVTYTVTYRICELHHDDDRDDEGGGGAVHVTLRICAADGTNLSSAAIAVTALSLDGGPLPRHGRSPARMVFGFDAQLSAYTLRVSTKDLAQGTHILRIAVAGDPATHDLRIVVGGDRDRD